MSKVTCLVTGQEWYKHPFTGPGTSGPIASLKQHHSLLPDQASL